MIDSKTIKESIKRNDRACKRLYESSIPYVYSVVKRYIWNDDHLRKDIIQEIYASVFTKLKTFDQDKGSFKQWIRKVSINHCLMYLRKASKQAYIVPISARERESKYDNNQNMHQLSSRDIERLLKKMPEGYKTIFMLVVIDEYTHDEVSKMLGISKETSRSQLSRAKKWIRDHFSNHKNVRVDGIF